MSNRSDVALEGALLGLALGDAVGFVVEAEPPDAAVDYVHTVLRVNRAGARHHPRFPFGQYSDDTQLARELLLSIAECGEWKPDRFARRIAMLVRDGRVIGAGPGTRTAAEWILLGAPWWVAGRPAPYAGNGSAMRVAPLGALTAWSEEGRLACAREQSRVTHRDARCAAGAVAVAGAVALAVRPGAIDARACLGQIAAWCEGDSIEMAALLHAVIDWLPLAPVHARARLHESGLDGDPRAPWRGISAFVLPSVAWSLYAFFRSPDDWWETVCTAIEPGGDTDTMAAMAGAIAGARLGVDALPAGLIERLTDRGTWGAVALGSLARRCAALSALDTFQRKVIVAEQAHV